MAKIIITKKDGSKIEKSPIQAVIWAGGNITILTGKEFGNGNEVIDDVSVQSIEIQDILWK